MISEQTAITVLVVISGENVEVLNQYKRLGTILDSLTFEARVGSSEDLFLLEALWF